MQPPRVSKGGSTAGQGIEGRDFYHGRQCSGSFLDAGITQELYRAVAFTLQYFALEGQEEGPVVAEVDRVPARSRAAVLSDIERVAEYGFKAPVSVRSIKGRSPMVEIRTAG